jgi:hypothetical protein
VLVVNVTVARPFASVVLVADANEPPAPVLDHVTIWPGEVTGDPFASVSCALTVIGEPAASDGALVVTTYFVAGTLTANVLLVALTNVDAVAVSV